MNSLSQETRPLVTDAPCFNYTGPANIRLLYRMPGDGVSDLIDVIGDPDNGAYEWVLRDSAGKIVKHSDCGYGSTVAAMRDGLIAYSA